MPEVVDGVCRAFDGLIAGAVFGTNLNRVQRLILLISRLSAEALTADVGSVWLLRGSQLHRAVIINRPVDLLDSFVMDIHEGLAGETVRSRAPVTCDDVQSDPRTVKRSYTERERLRTYIGCPIMVCSSCIGVMCFFRKRNEAFSREEVRLLTSFTDLLGLAIHHCITCLSSFEQWQRYIVSLFDLPLAAAASSGSRTEPNRMQPIWVLGSSLPKSINQVTLGRIQEYLTTVPVPVTCTQVAEATHISAASARRYLNYLHEIGIVKLDANYSNVGRPSYSYSLIS